MLVFYHFLRMGLLHNVECVSEDGNLKLYANLLFAAASIQEESTGHEIEDCHAHRRQHFRNAIIDSAYLYTQVHPHVIQR